VANHRAELARRLGTEVVVQFDEPVLPAALAGRLTGVTSLTPVHPVDEALATALLDECVARVGGEVALHCCAADVPWDMLRRSTIGAASVDASLLGAADLDGVGEFLESGRTVLLGVVPALAPAGRPSDEQLAKAAAAITDRLGFPRAVLRERIGITPACGLAGATPAWARTAIELARRVAEGFAQDPDAV
jgi:methionine synthase II (cobalamin-independent)